MQVVVDANQASQLPSARSVTREHSISLSPSVLAEILLRTNPIPTLKILQAYYIRLGLKTADVMQRLIQLPLDQIPNFEPFYNPRLSYLEDYEGLMEAIFTPSAHHSSWARQQKESHLKHCRTLVTQTISARKRLKSVIDTHCQTSGNNRTEARLRD